VKHNGGNGLLRTGEIPGSDFDCPHRAEVSTSRQSILIKSLFVTARESPRCTERCKNNSQSQAALGWLFDSVGYAEYGRL
jgi:hypothetical protein